MLDPRRPRWSKPANLLVATDLTDIDRLFPFALTQAKLWNARLVLVHILTSTSAITVDPGGLPYYNPAEAISYTEKFLGAYCAEAHKAGVACEVIVREGAPAQQILACAQHLKASQLLLGTRSRGTWGKLLLGSVAEQVLRSSPVPVITLGPEAHESKTAAETRTVLHATSLGKASQSSAALAREIALSLHARLVLMHVLPAARYGCSAEDLHAQTKRQLEALLPPRGTGCICETLVTTGDPGIEILAEASALHADLIVLGAEHSSTLRTLTREGTVYRVLAHARCPVLTLLEEEDAGAEPGEQNLALHG